eukprot:63387-Pleurochrysis_carterae.AAC.1
MQRCAIDYTPPIHPPCSCNRFRNSASVTDVDLCVKETSEADQEGNICYPRQHGFDPIFGGRQNFGCPSDM